MDLSFQEKSAWGLLAGILVVSAFYFPRALAIVEFSGNPVALIAISVVGIVAIVVIEALYHGFIAATGSTGADERDRLIDLRAERVGGLALGIALFTIVGHVVGETVLAGGAAPSGLLVVVYIIGALTASEVVKLASQIWFYRTGR